MDDLDQIAAGVRRLTAPNPSPMTKDGTQTYLVGRDEVAVIDPGPADEVHIDRIIDAMGQGEITHILVTHAHLDHSAAAHALSDRTGAPVLAFGDAAAGRSAQMTRLANAAEIAGGEGVDEAFRPHVTVSDGQAIQSAEWRIEALHTPGHMSNHLCFALPDAGVIFSGDHVMGWSSTLISPPDGSLTDFMQSLDTLLERPERTYLPGHGEPVVDGHKAAADLRDHRRTRERQVIDVLSAGPVTIADLTRHMYADVPVHLHLAASRNVLAHLLDLVERGHVELCDDDFLAGRYRRL